jgi:hypothetical protein
MAEINMLKGTMRRKFGKFVGSSWRGIDYVKLWGKPGNPRTAEQVAVRDVFRRVSSIAKAIYAKVLKPFTFPTPRKLTAYNQMLKVNRPMFEKGSFDPMELRIFNGPLENSGLASALRNGSSVEFTYGKTTLDGMGENDVAVCVIADESGDNVRCATGLRGAGACSVSLASVPNAGSVDFTAYLAFSRAPKKGTGEQGIVSPTISRVVV